MTAKTMLRQSRAGRGADYAAPVENHADGFVVQLSAAFDAIACAVAHFYGHSDPDTASFMSCLPPRKGIGRRLHVSMKAVRESKDFQDLAYYRNLAAHRGLIATRAKAGFGVKGWTPLTLHIGNPPPGAPDPDDAEVVPILRRLAERLGPPLDWLADLAMDGWS